MEIEPIGRILLPDEPVRAGDHILLVGGVWIVAKGTDPVFLAGSYIEVRRPPADKILRIPVTALKELVNRFDLKTAVLHAWDGDRQHIVTYGSSVVHCDYAAQAGTIMEKAFNWEGVAERLPSRVRKLKTENEKLKAEVAELNNRLHERTQNLLSELGEERRARQAGLAHWPKIPDGQNYPVIIDAAFEVNAPALGQIDGYELRAPTRKEREDEDLLYRAGTCTHRIRQSAVDLDRCWTCQLSGLPTVVTVPS